MDKAMNLLVIQNDRLDPLSVLGECLAERNVQAKVLLPVEGDSLPAQIHSFDGLIILGGPMHAADDQQHPYLRDVIRLVHSFDEVHKPVLGVCLGAQLVARAFGGRVYPHDVMELGFTQLHPVQAAIANDPVLKHCPESIHLMQWHFDTFDLPNDATLLMTGQACQNQVYRIHDNIYGFQCHLEVDEVILQGWLNYAKDYLQQNYPDFPTQLSQQVKAYLAESKAFCRNVCHAWLDLVELRNPLQLETQISQ